MTNTSSSTSSSSSSFGEQSIDPSMVTPSPYANFESSDPQEDTIPLDPTPRVRRTNIPLQRSISTAASIPVNIRPIVEVIQNSERVLVPPAPKPREHIVADIDDFLSIADHDCKFCTYNEWVFNFEPSRYVNEATGMNDISKADHIHWLTISDSKTIINGYFGNCKIQVTARSDVEFNDCEIFSPGLDIVETPIEVFAGSKASFNNCVFHDVPFNHRVRPNRDDGTPRHGVGVVARDRADVTFVNCIFNVDDVGALVLDHSVATFIDCTFNQHSDIAPEFNRFCIYAYRGSTVNIKRCRFHKFNGKHVFALDFSTVNVNEMTSNRAINAITVANESVANIEQLRVFDTKHAGIRASKSSKLFMYDAFIEDSEGNGIQMEQSTGIVVNTHINNAKYPSIFITGANANPIFERCIIENSQSFAIGVRHCARPVFNHILIRNCASYSVKANTFCCFEMYNVIFETVSKPIIMLAGKSQLYIDAVGTFDPTIEYSNNIPPNWRNISDDSLYVQHVYDTDTFTMVRSCTTVDRRTFTPMSGVTRTFRNGIHVISWRQPPTVKSVTEVNEDTLFNRVGVSYLLTFDVEKISTFEFTDAVFNNQVVDRNADPKIPDLLRHRTKDQTKRAHKHKEDTMYTCTFCEKQVDIASDRVRVVLPCGHLCCEDCFNRGDHVNDHCPTCDTVITQVKDLYFVDQYCCTCLDATPTTLMLPCCHVCTCYACATSCMDRSKCPICNMTTTGFIALE